MIEQNASFGGCIVAIEIKSQQPRKNPPALEEAIESIPTNS